MGTRKWLSENIDDIIAYIPCYENGNVVNAVKKDGETVLIDRSIKYVINTLIKDSTINIGCIKRRFRESFGAANLTPLPLGVQRVFIPVKVRKTIGVNDGSFGYVDLEHIEDVVVRSGGTVIKLRCGSTLACLESVRTVRSRMSAGRLMEEKLPSLLMGERGARAGMMDCDRAATKGDIGILACEIMRLRDKIGRG